MRIFQFILISLGFILILMMFIFLINPNYIYFGHLTSSKRHMIKTYQKNKYDFISNGKVQKIISDTIDQVVGKLTKEGMMNYFLSIGIIGGANIFTTLIGVIGYSKKIVILMITSGVFSLIIGLYVFVKLKDFNYEVKQILYQVLNGTNIYRKNIRSCSICYQSIEKVNSKMPQILNVIALSFHAYQCCGVKSVDDVMHEDEIPYTCCRRNSYRNINVSTSEPCLRNNIYSPCLDEIFKFLLSNSIFILIKVSLSLLCLFSFTYAIPTIIFESKTINVCTKNSSPIEKIDNEVDEEHSVNGNKLESIQNVNRKSPHGKCEHDTTSEGSNPNSINKTSKQLMKETTISKKPQTRSFSMKTPVKNVQMENKYLSLIEDISKMKLPEKENLRSQSPDKNKKSPFYIHGRYKPNSRKISSFSEAAQSESVQVILENKPIADQKLFNPIVATKNRKIEYIPLNDGKKRHKKPNTQALTSNTSVRASSNTVFNPAKSILKQNYQRKVSGALNVDPLVPSVLSRTDTSTNLLARADSLTKQRQSVLSATSIIARKVTSPSI